MHRDMSRAAFEAAVYRNWAERFGCTVAALHSPGTEVLPEAQFAESGAIHIWVIDRHAFARLDPALTEIVGQVIASQSSPVALTAAHLTAAPVDLHVRKVEDSVLTYLYPPDLRPVEVPAGFDLRQLAVSDEDALTAMKATCRPEEVDEGEVAVDDEIGFGCFHGTDLVAVATGFRLTGFMDIGVLADPGYRRLGLGKAVVTALCRWCIDHDLIAQYRCRVDNMGSRRISESLGFDLILDQQSIYLETDTNDR